MLPVVRGPKTRFPTAMNFPPDGWAWLECGRLTALPPKRSPSMSKNIGSFTPVVRAGDLLSANGEIGIVDGSTVDGPATGSLAEGGYPTINFENYILDCTLRYPGP